jgi:DNA-directed RNA polymerase specialized sigma24 family protein
MNEVNRILSELRDDLVALDAALTRLAGVDPQAAKLVELRHFAGLTVGEAARALGISPRSADRLWAFARAWLHRDLAETPADPNSWNAWRDLPGLSHCL